MKLAGKVMVVTGGGSGIGRDLVLGLVERGARVAAVDIREDQLAAVADEVAGNWVSTHVVDVTDRDAVAALPEAVVAVHGVVDGYISNAGIIQPFVTLEQLDYDTIDRVINVNLFGPINMAKAFLPALMDRPEAHVANVSSMGGFLPVPGQTVYGAAKAGVKLLTEGLYAELLETNVHVSVIMPGAVATSITENSGVDIPGGVDMEAAAAEHRTTSASDAAQIILNGIEADRLHILVGRDAKMMYVLNRTAPKRSTHLIQKQMKDLLS